MDIQFTTDFLSGSLRMSAPILFATIGGVFAERSGVMNIGLEAMILIGAFGAALGSFYTGSPIGGLVFSMMLGCIAAFLLAVLTVGLHVNQLIAGVAMNMLVGGATAFLARVFFGVDSTTNTLAGFSAFKIPVLSSIPVLGPVLFNQDILIYLLFILVPLSHYILFHTHWGLQIRAIGEYPQAADTAGVNVISTRYFCVCLSGIFGALGGAHIVLSQVYVFTENMSAGKGFIALAAIILGRWNPFGALFACLLFGLFEALQLNLQFSHPDIPYQIFSMLPYLVSVLAIIATVGKKGQPNALGQAFERGGK